MLLCRMKRKLNKMRLQYTADYEGYVRRVQRDSAEVSQLQQTNNRLAG